MVIGFCVKTDGGVSYLACPFCYAHLCESYDSSFHNIRESDAGSSSDDSQNRDDEVYSCLRSIASSEYAQVTIGRDMWVACSSFRELEKQMSTDERLDVSTISDGLLQNWRETPFPGRGRLPEKGKNVSVQIR